MMAGGRNLHSQYYNRIGTFFGWGREQFEEKTGIGQIGPKKQKIPTGICLLVGMALADCG
jgi:hypothetical protein